MERNGDVFSNRPNFLSMDLLKKAYNNHESFAFHRFNESYLRMHKIAATSLHQFTHKRTGQTEELIQEETNLLIQDFLSRTNEPQCVQKSIEISVGSVLYQILYGKGENIRDDKLFQRLLDSSNDMVEFGGGGSPLDVLPWLQFVMPWKIKRFLQIQRKAADIVPVKVKEHMKTFDKTFMRDITDMLLTTDLPENSDDETMTLTKIGLLHPVLNELIQAGQETTSTMLSWLILYMTAFPEVQERVHQEIKAEIGTSRCVTLNDKRLLPFTEATINEVLRITAASPFSLPHSAIQDTKINGYDIDKDTVILTNLHSACIDEQVWVDPEIFRPERFLNDKNELNTDKCKLVITFGLGRRCIGENLANMELFLLFSNLMQRCSFKKAGKGVVDLTPIPGIVHKPKPVEIIIAER